jgi:hypothetical protein
MVRVDDDRDVMQALLARGLSGTRSSVIVCPTREPWPSMEPKKSFKRNLTTVLDIYEL